LYENIINIFKEIL